MQWNKRKHCHEMGEGYASQLTFTCSKWTIQTLREGYTVKFFFHGISWNKNLTLISQCIFTLNSN